MSYPPDLLGPSPGQAAEWDTGRGPVAGASALGETDDLPVWVTRMAAEFQMAVVRSGRTSREGSAWASLSLSGGLPEDWGPVATVTTTTGNPVQMAVVRREAGGWALLDRRIGTFSVAAWRLALISATLTDLTAQFEDLYRAQSLPPGSQAHVMYEVGLALLRQSMAPLYDLDDPTERAEATLLALDGPLRTPPKADQPWGDTHDD